MKPHVSIDQIKDLREGVESEGDVFRPFVEFWRGDHLVMCAQGVQQDISHTAAAIGMMVPIIGPSHIATAYDVNMSTAINPSTGEEWKPGEMTEAREEGLPAAAAVIDALMLMVASDDDVEGTLVPYSIFDNAIHWQEPRAMPSGWGSVGGALMQRVRSAYDDLQLDIRQAMLAGGPSFGLTPKEAEVHLDAVAIKILLGTGQHHIVVGPSGDDERDNLLMHSLENGPTPEELNRVADTMTQLDDLFNPGMN